MRDLRGMAQTNAIRTRHRGLTRRDTVMRAAQILHERFADAEGRIATTFQVIWLTAWAPHPTQPKPLRRGSATTKLEIGRAHVRTPVTNAHLVCRLLLEKKNKPPTNTTKNTLMNSYLIF